MSRYIDAEALIEQINSCSYETWSKDVNRAWWAQVVKVKDNIVECIKRQPTADVVEVKHGEWIVITEERDTIFGKAKLQHKECSVCGYPMRLCGSLYCGNCGAKMDGERSKNGT